MAAIAVGKMALPVKVCRVCGIDKRADDFHVRKESGALRGECKQCISAINKARCAPVDNRRRVAAWIKVNPERHLANQRNFYHRHRKHLKGALSATLRSKKAWCKKNGIPFAITAVDVVDLFHAQDGKCVLTGRPMVWGGNECRRDTLSIDRIEGHLGYVPGNIRLLTYQANFARNQFSDDELFEFCRAVLKHKRIRNQ